MFIIPESFQLHGQTITVEFDPNLINNSDDRGQAMTRLKKIKLQSSTESIPVPQTCMEQTFCHELMHFILIHAESKMGDDEKFVNLVGNLLHQALTTMTFPKDKK